MSEKVIVRQNNRFETEFLAIDPHHPDADEFQSIAHLHALTPYGMLLASLGACSAIVLHTYAQNHAVDLQSVELRLAYDRVFQEDCETCTEIDQYEEQIDKEIELVGDISPADRQKLLRIAHQCPIHKMLMNGIKIESRLAPTS